jgi:glutamate synthase (NADPH/NADH) large chain/glutamate synthase (ferredoxin)
MGFATAPLIATGCVMMRACHLNTCPVGVATQDPELRKRFRGKPEHVIEYFFHVAEDVREIMASLGVRRFDELVGRVDLLEPDEALSHWRARGIDLTHLLRVPDVPTGTPLRRTEAQASPLGDALDWQLIEHGGGTFDVRNVNRAVGGLLSYHVTKHGLSERRSYELHGSAGQSFGAWLAPGLELTLVGDANDYVGKGLSGGVLAVRPPDDAAYRAEDNVIVGNTVLYGATAGRAFFRGQAGERFAVRNSGASAVVEGVGDHGCEYMTGGRVVVVGATGRNFAAGMSGGIAYVLDLDPRACNTRSVDLDLLATPDEDEVRLLLREHVERTGSTVAAALLADWNPTRFTKVMPHDLKAVLDLPISAGGIGFVTRESEEAVA